MEKNKCKFQFIHKYNGLVPNKDILRYCEFINGELKPIEIDNEPIGWLRINTNVKDFNDQDIYNGDILECHINSFDEEKKKNITKTYYNVVEYWTGGSGVGFRVKGGRFTKMLTTNYIYNKKAVVVGNIFQNSNLLD